jgi:hypothetical protein
MNIQVLQQDKQSERSSTKEREQEEEREEDLSDDERIKRKIYRVEKLHNKICRVPRTKTERYDVFNLDLYTLSFDSLAEN